MAEVAVSSQSVRNRRFIPSVYIKTTPAFVLALRKKKETATSAVSAISFFYAQDIRLSSIRPFAFNDGVPLSAWQFGCRASRLRTLCSKIEC